MFEELSQSYNLPLKEFDFFEYLSTEKSWNSIEDSLKYDLIKDGEQYLNFQYPPLPATLFMSFIRTGNRVNYENLYFLRRRALNSLVLAECLEKRGRFLDDIINGIFVLCEESAWQLPSHNNYKRDTPHYILSDNMNPVLDLFACETGAQLSMVRYLLKDTLDQISPFIIKRMEDEITFRIITPYLNKHFWWMGKDGESMNNWTIWCTQNTLLTIFTSNQSDTVKRQAFLKASKSIDYFLKEYGEDGCCDEGPQYYRHAGLCFFHAVEILNEITQGYFTPLYQENKIKNIASYIEKVHVEDGYYINYGDCSPIAGRCNVREFLFGKRTNNETLMSFAGNDFKKNDPLLKDEINLFYRLQSIFHNDEILNYTIKPIVHEDIYYPSVGVFIARDEQFCLAVKSGDNNDSHNHNDTGSFTVYKNGKPLFIDIGVESYTKKTFSPKRYDIWTMQSDYHNLPTINGCMQQNGAKYRATNVITSLCNDTASIEMNIETAYPKKGFLKEYQRFVSLIKGSHIVITDKIIPQKEIPDIIFNLITYEKPRYYENQLSIGNLGIAKIIGTISDIVIEQLPINDSRLKTAWKHDIYRTRIRFRGNQFTLEIL